MSDWISREVAMGALEDRRNKYLEDGPNWLQIQMDILTIRALPAVQPDADELVGHMTKLIAAGLDRIEQLTAELADAEALIEAQAKDHASNNIRFAEAEHRAKTAEAERDRLREALEQIEIACEEEIRARTAGMSEAALGKSRILPLLQVPRNIARAALKGESHE